MIGFTAASALIGIVLTAVLGTWAATALKRRHPDAWLRVVGGAEAGGSRVGRQLEYMKFWWSGEYRSLGDAKIDTLALACVAACVLTVAFVLFTLLVGLWSALVSG